MLINLSNHPATKWTTTQRAAATELYGEIKDLPFPNIPPAMSATELDELVNEYHEKVNAHKPAAVHLMGEMTFTYRLVNQFKKQGLTCIASTTNRTVEERDGKKIVLFEFVQFRVY